MPSTESGAVDAFPIRTTAAAQLETVDSVTSDDYLASLRSAIDEFNRATNGPLAKFLNSKIKLSEAECTAALNELVTLEPDLKDLDVSPREMQHINAAIAGSKIDVPYACARAFIINFFQKAKYKKIEPQDQSTQSAAAARSIILASLSGIDPASARLKLLLNRSLLHESLDSRMESVESVKDGIIRCIQAIHKHKEELPSPQTLALLGITLGDGTNPELDSAFASLCANIQEALRKMELLLIRLTEFKEQLLKLQDSLLQADITVED